MTSQLRVQLALTSGKLNGVRVGLAAIAMAHSALPPVVLAARAPGLPSAQAGWVGACAWTQETIRCRSIAPAVCATGPPFANNMSVGRLRMP